MTLITEPYLITEDELATKIKSIKNNPDTDLIIISASHNRQADGWVVLITHTQIDLKKSHLYKIKVRDEIREKSYKNLDVLVERMKKKGAETVVINLI